MSICAIIFLWTLHFQKLVYPDLKKKKPKAYDYYFLVTVCSTLEGVICILQTYLVICRTLVASLSTESISKADLGERMFAWPRWRLAVFIGYSGFFYHSLNDPLYLRNNTNSDVKQHSLQPIRYISPLSLFFHKLIWPDLYWVWGYSSIGTLLHS